MAVSAKSQLISDDSWKGATAMTSHGGLIYLVHGEIFYVIDPGARSYRKSSDEAWSTRFMVSDGSSLYTIEGDGGLYRVNPDDLGYERINGDDWSSTRAVTILDGRLWTADQSNNFYSVDLTTGVWEAPRPGSQDGALAQDAANAQFLAGLDGMLYAWGGDGISAMLWRDGSAGGLHAGEFREARALVACRGRLYLNHDGHFYEFPIPDRRKGEYSSHWQPLETAGAGRWDAALVTSTGERIHVLDETGGLYEIVPEG